ncbi:MAG: amino acid adenylation domain-containing protein [Gammaproteobacteria bacterium]|nr:amino acid adenylation domain-containing protein [Gammaproteobacteria bacterium]HRX70146.1 amino acid adenylation domain-containing protein [Candidatus Competibacteraceae bacterium]
MRASEIIEALRRRGVTVALDGERLNIRAPKGVLTEDDKQALALNKNPILARLRAEREEPEEFPLTEIQQAYWVGRRSMMLGNVGCHAYREFVSPELDPARLEAAWQTLIARHDMLRAVISENGRQRVLAETPPYRIEILDLRDCADAPEQLAALRESLSHQTFDPARWPLFDIRLVRLDGQTRVHIGMDLLIADAASMLQLYREWGALYQNPQAVLPPLHHRFADYARSGSASLEEQAKAEAYWRSRLDTLPGPPELPLVKAPAQIERPRFTRHSHILSAPIWAALRERARAAGLTPSNLLVAAYADILATWSKTQRFLITLTTFRAPEEYAGVVGDFTSTLLLEVDARAETFTERAKTLQTRLLRDLDHDAWSGVRVIRELARARHGLTDSIPVVFTSALGHRRATETALPTAWLGHADYAITQTPQVWIDHHVIEDGDRLILSWDAVEELFPAGLIGTLFAAYRHFVEALAVEESAWNWPLGAHLPVEQRERRLRANATTAPLPDGLLHQGFFAWAERQPERLAVVTSQRSLNYGELAAVARRVAEIVRAAGCGPNQLVGIAMNKGWEQAAAALGILAAGAAYLPIDPALPELRRRYLAENGALTLVFTQCSPQREMTWPENVQVVAVDELAPDDEPLASLPSTQSSDLAYVIYTSGSTGQPKGVMIEHQAALNTLMDIHRRFGIGADDAVLGLSSLSFDLSVYDLFGLLGCGGRLALPDPERLRDPGHWLELMTRHRVTVWNTVPALLAMLLEYGQPLPDGLRVVMLSGDWTPLTLPGRLKALAPNATLYVLGGATEAAIWSNYFRVDQLDPAWRSIPYGWPLANQTYHILNEALEPTPDGVPGRLFIGGAGLARGYWGDVARTETKFIHHPGHGERLYETGDLGSYLSDGAIEFLGREDFQVKVRGHRIELGEIEIALRTHPGVGDALVIAQGDPGSERRLIAYVVPAPTASAEPESALEVGDVLMDPVERLAFRLRRPALRPATDHNQIALPGAAPDPVIWRRRRTVRRYTPDPVPLDRLAELLGVLRALSSADTGLPKYRYASAGTAYPVQLWLHVQTGRVDELAGGLYYYHPDRHSLEPIAAGLDLPDELHLSGNRPIFASAAFSLFFIAEYPAIRPLYGALARDFCLLEAGYMGQLLMEEAARLELGLCAIGAVNPDRLPDRLELGEDRELLHSFLGGLPAEDEQNAPGAQPLSTLIETLKGWLAERLPDSMTPEAIIPLDALPLTANGKIDRGRLPGIAPSIPRDPAPLQSALEATIAGIFAEVLELPAVDRERQVFELGGTSVHIVRIHRRLSEMLGKTLDIVELFRFPSVAQLAVHLERRGEGADSAVTGSARGAARRAVRSETTGQEKVLR